MGPLRASLRWTYAPMHGQGWLVGVQYPIRPNAEAPDNNAHTHALTLPTPHTAALSSLRLRLSFSIIC